MVCNRCILAVETLFNELELPPERVALGEVILAEEITDREQKTRLAHRLSALGFELLDDKNTRLTEQIKNYIVLHIHHQEPEQIRNWSELLSHELHKDYSYLSKLFSATEGITLEQYIIRQKIEKVKELLAYGELTLSEISWQLGYSNVAHLSAQFKKVTGLTPRQFKSDGNQQRNTLDSI